MTPKVRIQPFFWYAEDAEAAARFYASIFPDSHVDRVVAMPGESPSGPPGSVQVVEFTLFGQPFKAMSAGPHDPFNDAVSLMVTCEDQAELDRYWDALIEGGGHAQACGWLTDRFGVRWQIVPAHLDALLYHADPAAARRVSDALMGMIRIDVGALEAAARG